MVDKKWSITLQWKRLVITNRARKGMSNDLEKTIPFFSTFSMVNDEGNLKEFYIQDDHSERI